jgi:hypothetical protein
MTGKRLVGILAATGLGTTPMYAQRTFDAPFSVIGTVGPMVIPDVYSTQCGRNGSGGNGAIDAGVATVVRPWRRVIVQADLRTAAYTLPLGCNLVGFEVDTAYAMTDRRHPFTTSTVRVGVETPSSIPVLLRLTAGVGRVWGSPARPLTVAGMALATRGRVRIVAELDRYNSRADAVEVRTSFTGDRMTTRRPIVIRPRWFVGRMGVEIPLRAPVSRAGSPP